MYVEVCNSHFHKHEQFSTRSYHFYIKTLNKISL